MFQLTGFGQINGPMQSIVSSKGIGYLTYKQIRRSRGHQQETNPVFYQLTINFKEEDEITTSLIGKCETLTAETASSSGLEAADQSCK